MSLPAGLDPDDIARHVPRFRHFFRYPLDADDFHPLRDPLGDPFDAAMGDVMGDALSQSFGNPPNHAPDDVPGELSSHARRVLGYYAAKPLYGRLDKAGRVDRSAGFNGEIAGLFVPMPAISFAQARLFFARLPAERIVNARGRRDWPAIRAAAERELLAGLRGKLA